MNTYAARIDGDTVVQVIVGSPEWAEARLGGVWVASDVKVGIGWTLIDGVITPPEPEPSEGDEDES
jgi:hypothetical protein